MVLEVDLLDQRRLVFQGFNSYGFGGGFDRLKTFGFRALTRMVNLPKIRRPINTPNLLDIQLPKNT